MNDILDILYRYFTPPSWGLSHLSSLTQANTGLLSDLTLVSSFAVSGNKLIHQSYVGHHILPGSPSEKGHH